MSQKGIVSDLCGTLAMITMGRGDMNSAQLISHRDNVCQNDSSYPGWIHIGSGHNGPYWGINVAIPVSSSK